ncbi:hypothetical protein [Streptosporangium saharense]|uniref:hypothetical protein n=1 Tax=Streptosporangium saharense TaxID=1706840 RepID=UPI003316BAA0
MSDFERTLRETLGHAAGNAPRLGGMAADRLETGYRRRRRRLRAAVATAAVVAVAGGGVVGLRVGDGTRAASLRSPTGDPSAAVTVPRPSARPIEQVWPQAVVRIPLKDRGRNLRPVTLVDDRTLLVTAEREVDHATALYTYDLTDRKLRKIAEVPEPKGTERFASDLSVGDGQVAWWTATKDRTHIWAASSDGAGARLVADQDGEGFDGFGVANGSVVFSPMDGGVFTVPLTGGRATRIAAGDGQYLLSWPWAGSPGTGESDKPPFTRLVNLETGQVSQAVVHEGERVYACGVRFCIGTTNGGWPFTRLRDGSRQKYVPVGYQDPAPPSQDRFHLCDVGKDGPGIGICDVDTGTVVDLGLGEDVANGAVSTTDRSGRIMSYRVKGESYVVILSRIP